MSVVTRFAPSPTGYLHIGGARTALFNYLFSKNKKGKFLLRIEDTDEKRSTKEAIDAILQGLNWLGLKHDGDFILQSKNSTRHQEIAHKLLENEKAYLCYTSLEELDDMRKSAEKKGEVFRFKSPWRDKTLSQSSTIKPSIRIKAPLEGETIIKDLIQGEIKVKNSELDDLVMLRGDGTATYMLAVVVDDFDMKITHIIRGDDHLTNAFRQKIIYQAMNWNIPEFAHIPLIHSVDGSKMSKRHGATSVMDYKQMGYLPISLRNYLLRLGWSHGDSEIISDEEAISWFNLDKVGRSPARFDFAKLNNLNKHYIKQSDENHLFLLMKEFTKNENYDEEKILKSLKFLKERSDTIKDLAKSCEVYDSNAANKISINEEERKIVLEKRNLLIELKDEILFLEVWNHDSIKKFFDEFTKKREIKIKDIGLALRIALTFSSSSAGGIFDVVEILEKDEVVKRINQILDNII